LQRAERIAVRLILLAAASVAGFLVLMEVIRIMAGVPR
jgi:hypothetical protein